MVPSFTDDFPVAKVGFNPSLYPGNVSATPLPVTRRKADEINK